MSSVGSKGVIIQDALGGDAATVTDSRLDVNIAGMTLDNVTVDSEFPAAATITDNFSNPSTTSAMSMGMVYDGSAWDMMRGDSTNGLLVNLGSNNDVTVNTISGFATSANQLAAGHTIDCNSTFVKLKDGSGTSIVSNSGRLDVCLHSEDGTGINETSNALDVNIAGAGAQVTVSQASSARTIIGAVEVIQDTAADFNATVTGTVGHNITAMVSEVNADVGTSPEDLRAAGDVTCKRVDMMASPSNTGYIWVGDASVANDGTGGGIRLGAGDFYSIDVNAINDIHVAATVNGEDIMYTYYT